MLDYYADSSTLIVSEVRGEKVREALLGLPEEFYRERRSRSSTYFYSLSKLEEMRTGETP